MGRRRRWREHMLGAWVPQMSCFRPGIAPRDLKGDNDEKQEEEKKNDLSYLDTNSSDQLGAAEKKKWSQCRRYACGMTLLLFSSSIPANSRNITARRKRRNDRFDAENNKSWLLEETHVKDGINDVDSGVKAVDSQSMHSSFRFSFGSQVESHDRAMEGNNSDIVATTVLILNLEKAEEDVDESTSSSSSEARDHRLLLLKSRRLEYVERSISPFTTTLVRFSFQEIKSSTRDFSEERVLGRGALSCVYRGRMGSVLMGRRWRAVAIKQLLGAEKECAKAFCRELMIAGSLQNPNVVPILGFCIDREGLFLVYKYVNGGSLDLHLHPEKKEVCNNCIGLSWGTRFNVAVGTARAMEYLHYGTDRCIVHRDIKPSNILLSSKKNPKLCDFGLATWTYGPSVPFLCKNVKGTFGYLAPEYFQHGKLSDKTDVYAFGVVLLELISGRKPIDTCRPHGGENLVLWAKPLLQQGETSMDHLVDPKLRSSSYNQREMWRTMRAAIACLNSDESQRPRITEVISMLCGEEENCNGWSVLTGNGCFAGFDSHIQDLPSESDDIRSHLALAMLGVSDTDEDDMYDR